MGKHKIILQEWTYRCGDRCCDDYGWYLFINDVEVDRYFPYDEEYIRDMLKALGITEYDIEVIHEYKEYDYKDDYLRYDLEEDDEEDD